MGVKEYKTVQEVREANEAIGHKFFDNQWYCKIADEKVYFGVFFITKERLDIGSIQVPESFTIRQINQDGSIGTVGRLGAYKTLEIAQKELGEFK